jgi:hypothetical protein
MGKKSIERLLIIKITSSARLATWFSQEAVTLPSVFGSLGVGSMFLLLFKGFGQRTTLSVNSPQLPIAIGFYPDEVLICKNTEWH